jgi:hypothetical protein
MKNVIDIQNKKEILTYLINKFIQLGWKISGNACGSDNLAWYLYPNKTAKYFEVNYILRRFSWSHKDEDTHGDEDVIATNKDAISFMNFVEKAQNIFDFHPYPNPLSEVAEQRPSFIGVRRYNKNYCGQWMDDGGKLPNERP